MKIRSLVLYIFFVTTVLANSSRCAEILDQLNHNTQSIVFAHRSIDTKTLSLCTIGILTCCLGLSRIKDIEEHLFSHYVKNENSDDTYLNSLKKQIQCGINSLGGAFYLVSGILLVLLSQDLVLGYEKIKLTHPEIFSWCTFKPGIPSNSRN